MTLAYDRRAPAELMRALLPGGWAHSLVEYARAGQFSLDLQLRGYAGKGHWATLYVGLTKVLDLHIGGRERFWLDAHESYRTERLGWDPRWGNRQSDERLGNQWRAVDEYLERVIPTIGDRFKKEGAVQAAVCGFESRDMIVIDRESAVAHSNAAERASVKKRLEQPLFAAMDAVGTPRGRPTSLGGECDALALRENGELLAIEIKPARTTQAIRWAPLQARHYANLFSEWARTATDAGQILLGMAQQRVDLRLAHNVRPSVSRSVRVRPVVAIGKGYSQTAINGLKQVQERLLDAGLNDPPLEVFSVTLAGRLDPVPI